jgi:hypothetical protein
LEFDSLSNHVTCAKIKIDDGDSSDDDDGTVSYLSTLPKFNDPTSSYGRFIPTSNNYLIGGDGTSINTNILPSSSFSMPTRSTFVMTSDISTTIVGCYKLFSLTPTSTSSLKRITTISGINTGIISNFIKSTTVLTPETSIF